MGNELKIFENEMFGTVRTIKENNKVLFCGSDMAKALDYTNPRKAILDHCRCVTKRDIPHPQSKDKMIYIYFSPWDDEYFLSKTEIDTGYILTQVTDKQGVYKTMQKLGANKEQIDEMFENLNYVE